MLPREDRMKYRKALLMGVFWFAVLLLSGWVPMGSTGQAADRGRGDRLLTGSRCVWVVLNALSGRLGSRVPDLGRLPPYWA